VIDTEQLIQEYEKLSDEYSLAKSHKTYLEEFKKSLHAMLMKRAEAEGAKSVSAQERDAYANEEYIAHLRVTEEQEKSEVKSRYHLKRLEMEYEIWRTQQANERYITR
jgi:hypothetical protein